ncbi:unnamed protein product [Effrenium voratum]|uniref:C3H1-type domain-containing protein n=1 Tax=Effrenium voratum TaxID=2562239 RepID=A0AA36J9L5_9DINO|nr:unnamed protein product [Effrenium voratum]
MDWLQPDDDEAVEEEVEAPSKRPRLQAGDDDDAFDFEADLQKVAEPKESKGSGMLSDHGVSCTQLVVAEPPPQTLATPSPAPKQSATRYIYNGRMKRWELRTAKPQKEDAKRVQGPRRKVRLCRFYATGGCRWGNSCYYAHSEEELALEDAAYQQQVIAECAYKAWEDALQGLCSYAQSLSVRLALRFEAQPNQLLPTMEKAGLPIAGEGARAAVKMLLRLCHPDKCGHPEARGEVCQAISPGNSSCVHVPSVCNPLGKDCQGKDCQQSLGKKY